ncbi:hypothetical protein HanPSC8_Chr10g0442731 [Helianthus annuus]|nr:hypothetical protein HanPSC8_Chr10g0442731 [Helianthus annuus]
MKPVVKVISQNSKASTPHHSLLEFSISVSKNNNNNNNKVFIMFGSVENILICSFIF